MRLTCPICGERDSREFSYLGDAVLMDRPSGGADAFHAYVHIRENAAGETAELWHHAFGCSAWLKIRRDTVSHEVIRVELAKDAAS